MKTSEFDYSFPKELIAHEPAAERDHSRLMVLGRARQSIEHKYFYDIVEYLNPGDILVLNDTKVIPANLVGRKEEGGAKIEVLLARSGKACPDDENVGACFAKKQVWECLVKPGKRLKADSKVIFGNGEVVGKVLEKTETGEQIIEFIGDLGSYMRRHGEIPLPPYIKSVTSRKQGTGDRRQMTGDILARYQTVYACKEGASAAPTAGLHFTPELLKKIEQKGINVAYVTLHTGLATFKPVYAEKVEDHKMYSEYFEVPPETIEAVRKAKRVIAVGTTSVRALESSVVYRPSSIGLSGETNLFIYPGYEFKVVDAMVTNFHWPRSTLIMLVSAFAGKEFIMKAYQEAIQNKYRLFSFGDAMMIL